MIYDFLLVGHVSMELLFFQRWERRTDSGDDDDDHDDDDKKRAEMDVYIFLLIEFVSITIHLSV